MPEALDLLGAQLMLALQFYESNFNTNLTLVDTVSAEEKYSCKELFNRQGKVWCLRAESIPGNLTIKSISVDKRNLYLETAPLNWDGVAQVLKDQMLPFDCNPTQRRFSDSTNGQKLITISKPTSPKYEGTSLAPRCLWTIPLIGQDAIRRKMMIKLADVIYTADAYSYQGIGGEKIAVEGSGKGGRLELQVLLELQMQLQAEQRAILSLRGALRGELRLELQQILGLYYSIVRMNEDELLKFIVDHTEKHGEKTTVQVLNFALAGKIKRAQPKLTWREARAMARKLANSKPPQ